MTGEAIPAWRVRMGNQTLWLSRHAPYYLRLEVANADGTTRLFEVERWSPLG